MIKSFIATTREIDDAAAAVKEILTALEIEKNLMKNSLGIISCFSEFTDTGVVKAVCDALPFDCVGATTCIASANSETDQLIFTITVLTSNDCDFKTIMIPITEKYEDSINSVLSSALQQSEEKPALFLTYLPLINAISGDMMITAIDKTTGGIPLFGTMAVDHTMDYSTAKTIYNGEAYREAAILAAVCGSPEFSFEVASLDESAIRKQKAIITESNGNILIGVNGKTAMEYLEEIGLTRAELATGLGIIPLVVDHKDGTKPVARAVFALTPEGYAVCGGAMPVNATLSIGHVDAQVVVRTADETLKPLVKKDSVVLSYSCMARYLCLGANNSAEAEKVAETASGTNYMFACSGGEICPSRDNSGKLKNLFHNYTLVFCRLS